MIQKIIRYYPSYEAVAKVCQGYVFRIGGGNDKQVLRAVKCPIDIDKYG